MRQSTIASCWAQALLGVAWGAAVLVGPAHGQGAAVPSEHGQWAGPYQLALPDVPTATDGKEYAEIAHAAVLPPPASHPSMARVMFFARRQNQCYPLAGEVRQADGWLWRPRFPSNVERLPITGSPIDASADPFCSGHTFLPDGSLVVFGGLDVHEKMCTENCTQSGTGPGPGHLLTYRLDTSVDPPQWDTGWTVQMGRARWYPTSISMADGDTFVGGHGPTAEPGNACAPIYTENPSSGALYQVTYDRTYELLEWGTSPAFGPVVTSYLDSQSCGNENQGELARLLAYPRIHLLSNKLLFQTDAPMFPSPFGFGCRVMDVDPSTILCGDGRWSVQLNLPQPKRNGGNTVHLVYLNENPANPPRDVIYAIGGTDGSDEAIYDPGGPVHDLVEKVVLVDPDLASWAGSGAGSPPNLNTKRFNHNSVILLDGSILVNGGWHGAGTPGPVLNAERYRPPELFDIAEGSGNDVWKEMTTAVEPSHRRYHSVAGLLPDGRTFSAGGEGGGGGIESEHTVSVYSPSYLFHPRPEITSAPATIENIDTGGDPFFFVNVTLSSPTASFYRLGLIRNSSVTHAWDMNQRYVELDAEVFSQDGSNVTLRVTPQASGFAAPLGSYLMAVVEENAPPPPPAGFFLEQRWIPSPGVWVQVVDGS